MADIGTKMGIGRSRMAKPLAIDLFCGLGGWTEGLLSEGYYVVGFDIERHEYGDLKYPAQLVLQDVLTLHGSQFKDAALIVASPPCQEFSYMAMPWSKAKAKERDLLEGRDDPKRLTALFDACFRIQREAIEAAGHFIPLVVENVRGAQKWVGRSRWNFGSFHLWGDVPALMPMAAKCMKNGTGGSWFGLNPDGSPGALNNARDGVKAPGMNWSDQTKRGQDFTRLAGKHAVDQETGTKIGGDWFSDPQSTCRRHGSKSAGRKMASAMIAKIPLVLSQYIAATYRPAHAG
jgi:hypothetical protein